MKKLLVYWFSTCNSFQAKVMAKQIQLVWYAKLSPKTHVYIKKIKLILYRLAKWKKSILLY
jgi:hypothetical protein